MMRLEAPRLRMSTLDPFTECICEEAYTAEILGVDALDLGSRHLVLEGHFQKYYRERHHFHS